MVILCPTVRWNRPYKDHLWVWDDSEVYIVDSGERLHDWLRVLHDCFAGDATLYIIDDCSAWKALTERDMLSELAFSGCHAEQSVWVLTQKYNSILTDLREQVK